jgi:hypothetical protein
VCEKERERDRERERKKLRIGRKEGVNVLGRFLEDKIRKQS